MFKGMKSHLSCAVKYQKMKLWSSVNWVEQCESHKYTNKKNTKMNLRLAGFGWGSLFFFKGRGGGFVHWEEAAWLVSRYYHDICYTQNVRLVNKNWPRFKPGTCPTKSTILPKNQLSCWQVSETTPQKSARHFIFWLRIWGSAVKSRWRWS